MARKNKTPRRPSLAVVLGLGLGTALLGVLLAMANLASMPVQEVRSMPEAEKRTPGAVYLVKGNDAPSSAWRSARIQLERGVAGEVRLTEADLNAWADFAFGRGGRRTGEEPDAAPRWLGTEVRVSGVNFRFVEDRLQMSAVVEAPKALPGRRFVYQARGRLVSPAEGGLRFEPEEGTLGRSPLAQIPILGSAFHRQVEGWLSGMPEVEALRGYESAIEGAEISARYLTLKLR
jgi:hypothetical protein